ncbi:chymotrypsin-like elastase family member 3B isoform X2 [Hydra vulgaris]|uniref:Chymotrypsin-like elastase family member 3B isoform X2 n=1 Tax=Hydra vulgaris TaxID=6087 RepID=A0ABM4DGV2_HYDVU
MIMILSLIFSFGIISTASGCGTSKFQRGKVIAGTTAVHGSWPWQILILTNSIPICGGTLIAPNWILTAAHCLNKTLAQHYILRGGEHNINIQEGTEEDIPAADYFIHPTYNPRTANNDIALIKLSRPFKINDYVSTACLPSAEPQAGTSCYIAGWGKVAYPGHMTHLLQQGNMNVVDRRKCHNLNSRHLPWPITNSMICAGDGGSTPISGCHGDSGGPLVCYKKGIWEVHGAVSHGSDDCQSVKAYTVFANVAYFKAWIDEIIK